VKFREYLDLIGDEGGWIPLPRFREVVRHNTRPTSREEAIAASVLEQANPRENISGHAGWGQEETIALEQLWIHLETSELQWRDVPRLDKHLYSIQDTRLGPLPVPNAVRKPETIPMDLRAKIREALGEVGQEDGVSR